MQDLNYIRNIITEQVAEELKFEPWNEEILSKLLKKNDIDPALSSFYFPNGLVDIIRQILLTVDENVTKNLNLQELEAVTSIRKKVFLIIKARIMAAEKYKAILQSGISYYVMHAGIVESTKRLFETCDNIWQLVGDKSLDFNYYTKRINLSYVYLSTLMFWFNDKSQGYQDTLKFLEDRIEDIIKVGKFFGRKDEITKFIKKLPFIRLLTR